MANHFPEESILEHAKNFYWNTELLKQRYNKNNDDFLNLEILGEVIISFFEHSKALSPSECLELALRKVYDLSIKRPELFYTESPFAEDAYEAYVFTACSSFLHASKRVKGMPLTEFTRKYSPLGFENPDSPSFRQPLLLASETDMMRKARQRLLKQARVYPKNTQWNAITQDSEYEWTRYYDLKNADDMIRDTDKRIGNLYKGIKKAINTKQDNDKYQSKIKHEYKKFLSKLEKLRYEGFLETVKDALTRICVDTEKAKRYFGINLYRLERRLQPYKIIKEVKRLTECSSPEEEAYLLYKTVFLDEICFPKIYEGLLNCPIDVIQNYAVEFSDILSEETAISNLILDKLIEKGFLGEDWYTLFCNKTNEMAVEVFYDPLKVEFFTADNAQEKFSRILHAGVLVELCAACNSKFCLADLLI